MEQTRRLVLGLIGIAVCGCMICAPTPPPTPSGPVGWEPMGADLWPSSTLTANVDPVIQSAGQGGNHLTVNVTISAAGLSTATDVRLAAFLRDNGTQIATTNRVVRLDASSTNFTLNLVICPNDNPVVGRPMQFELWAAREGDHQLLTRKLATVTPACAGSACGACQ